MATTKLAPGSSRLKLATATQGPAHLANLVSTGAATRSLIHGVLVSTTPAVDKDTDVTHYITTTFDAENTYDARTTKKTTAIQNHREGERAAGCGIYRIVEVDGDGYGLGRYVAVSYRNCHGYPQAILVHVAAQAQGLYASHVGERRWSDEAQHRYADTRQECEQLIQRHIINHPLS